MPDIWPVSYLHNKLSTCTSQILKFLAPLHATVLGFLEDTRANEKVICSYLSHIRSDQAHLDRLSYICALIKMR